MKVISLILSLFFLSLSFSEKTVSLFISIAHSRIYLHDNSVPIVYTDEKLFWTKLILLCINQSRKLQLRTLIFHSSISGDLKRLSDQVNDIYGKNEVQFVSLLSVSVLLPPLSHHLLRTQGNNLLLLMIPILVLVT